MTALNLVRVWVGPKVVPYHYCPLSQGVDLRHETSRKVQGHFVSIPVALPSFHCVFTNILDFNQMGVQVLIWAIQLFSIMIRKDTKLAFWVHS
jgi:hypothetical protein